MKLKDGEFVLGESVLDIQDCNNGIVLKVVEAEEDQELKASILIKGQVPVLAAMFESLVESDENLAEVVSLFFQKKMYTEDMNFGLSQIVKKGEA